jgi:hypothetical protein
MRSLPLILVAVLSAGAIRAGSVPARPEGPGPGAPPIDVATYFLEDPTLDTSSVIAGAALDRLTHSRDTPAFNGDRPGSMQANYDASLEGGLFGFPLPTPYDQDDTFTGAVIFVVEAEGFSADPNGFFQISWGLWNSRSTGLNRTGTFESFSGDSFELLEFDYFPNVSPFFGGPFLAPTVFGIADPDDPTPDAFLNAAFAFGVEVELPLAVPLLAVIEHRPDVDALVTSVYQIVGARELLPLPGAVSLVPLDRLQSREYSVDTIGLTLWNDGFGGPTPAVRATLVFHAVIAARVLFENPRDLLRVPPASGRR